MCDINSFMSFCVSLAGQTFNSAGGRAKFQLFSVQANKLVYKVSTGKTRPHTRKGVGMVLDRYKKTESLRPKDYQDMSFNAPYILPLINLYSQKCKSRGNTKRSNDKPVA